MRVISALAAAVLMAAVAATPAAAQGTTDDAGLTVLTQFAEFGEPMYPPDFDHFGYVNPDAPKGGAVTLGTIGTFDSLNTIPLEGDWAAGLGLTGEALFTGSGDEIGIWYAALAESIAVPDDVSYAIFTIREGARYDDGTPVTAGDFVYGFNAIIEHGRPFLREFFADLTGVEALDDRRVRFDFATTDNWQTVALAARQGPTPRHWWEAEGRDIGRPSLEPPPVEGPYRIAAIDPGRSITYERVDDWWGADLPVNRGQFNFDRIGYVYYRDTEVLFEAFRSGLIDYRSENRAGRWATEYDFEAVENGSVMRDRVPDNSPSGFRGFLFNTRLPEFADVRVRAAIANLFDFEWLQRNIFHGEYVRAGSYYPNSDYGIEDFPVPEGQELALLEPHRDQLPAELFTSPFQTSRTDGSGRIRQQLRESLALFAEAGWEVRNGSLTDVATGEPLAVTFLMNTSVLEPVIQSFAQNLRRAGIDAGLQIVDPVQYDNRIDDFDFDITFIGLTFYPPPGAQQAAYWHSSIARENGSGNIAGIENPVIDAMLEEIMAAEGLDNLKAANRALDRVLAWNHYGVPTYYPDDTRIAYWNRFGRPERPPYYGVGFLSTWWVDPELDAALRR